MKKLTCGKCGYDWEPRKANPKCCPDCKSRCWFDPGPDGTRPCGMMDTVDPTAYCALMSDHVGPHLMIYTSSGNTESGK